MKKMLLLPLLLSTQLFISCHNKNMSDSSKETPAAATTPVNQNNASADVKAVKVDAAADMMNTGASYSVDSIAISGDILSVFVNYSGGCKEHSFELVSNGMYAKSMPPKIAVCLKHINNDDACRKLVMQELKFNVAAIKYKGSNSTTVIKLGDRQVTYTGK